MTTFSRILSATGFILGGLLAIAVVAFLLILVVAFILSLLGVIL